MFVVWDSLAAAVTGRRSWWLALVTALVGVAFTVLVGGNAAAGQSPRSVPVAAQSAQVDGLAKQFPGGDKAALIVVVSRTDGGVLGPSDIAAAQAALDRVHAAAQPGANPSAPPVPSMDSKAVLGVVPISADLSGLPLGDAVATLRTAAAGGLPSDLQVHVTGGPAFGADIASAFTNANVTLLAVTTAVVALLLIATYRSPVLWLVPLLVVGFADRVAAAAGTAVASLTGLSFDGATSGITSTEIAATTRPHAANAPRLRVLGVDANSRVRSASTTVALLATMAGPALRTARRSAVRCADWRRNSWRYREISNSA
ncbi:hypothetical protein A9W93_25130 [Mycobacterium colombiense]|nr:hypothetical protein A9W93_25130 [Mycobacterium colombiense]